MQDSSMLPYLVQLTTYLVCSCVTAFMLYDISIVLSEFRMLFICSLTVDSWFFLFV